MAGDNIIDFEMADDDQDEDNVDRILAEMERLRVFADDPIAATVADLLRIESTVLELLFGRLLVENPPNRQDMLNGAGERLKVIRAALERLEADSGWRQ